MATTYADVLVRNFKAARHRAGLDQDDLAARMRNLGYAWNRATVSKVERRERVLKAEEIFGLAYALETTISSLMAPRDEDDLVEFPAGQVIMVLSVRLSAVGKIFGSGLSWDGGKPVFDPTDYRSSAGMVSEITAGAWPRDLED